MFLFKYEGLHQAAGLCIRSLLDEGQNGQRRYHTRVLVCRLAWKTETRIVLVARST